MTWTGIGSIQQSRSLTLIDCGHWLGVALVQGLVIGAIGVWRQVSENKTGLWVAGEVLTELSLGREAAVLMRAGAIDGLSIGYRVVRAEPNRETGGRRLIEVDLWEVSLVTFPMLPTARAEADVPVTASDDIAAALAEALAG